MTEVTQLSAITSTSFLERCESDRAELCCLVRKSVLSARSGAKGRASCLGAVCVRLSIGDLEGKIMSMDDGLSEWRASMVEAVSKLQRRLEESLLSQAKLQEEVNFWRAATTKLQEEVNLCRAATTHAMGYKLKEPECYEGARDGRVLDDFLWDMGEYLALGGFSGEQEVRIAASYLKGTAKVWWRILAGDIAEGRTTKRVHSWDELKEALQEQFRPANAERQAKLKLYKLKHDGKIRDYINEFQDLMLEIKQTSDGDRLFMFERGLQPWAQVELRRHKPKNVSDAIAVAGRFFDFREKSDGKEDTQGYNTKGLSQPSGKPKSATQGGKRTEGSLKSISHLKGEKSASRANQANSSFLRCWTCDGAHTQNKCPQRQRGMFRDEHGKGSAKEGQVVMRMTGIVGVWD